MFSRAEAVRASGWAEEKKEVTFPTGNWGNIEGALVEGHIFDLRGPAPLDLEWAKQVKEVSEVLWHTPIQDTGLDQSHCEMLNEVAKYLEVMAEATSSECDCPPKKECDPGCKGWDVFNDNFEIQVCGSCNRFESDEDAARHVQDHLDREIPLRDNLTLQFARVLSEIRAAGQVEKNPHDGRPTVLELVVSDLEDSMDLSWERIEEVFVRAEQYFEAHKP